MTYSTTKPLVATGIFTALVIIFTHIFALETPFIRISFGFLPIALFAAMYGPIRAAIMAASADIIGCMIFSPGLFFPGFTFSAILSSIIYGYFFYQKEITLPRAFLACLLVFLIIDLGLNTLWLTLLYHKAASYFFWGRFIKSLVRLPIHTFLLCLLYRPLIIFLPKHSSH